MEFDQSYNGPVDWNFPSPTATPTTTSFGNNVFQTPKTATFPSHFQDAFVTPQMQSFATPQPQYPSATPVQRPQTSFETPRAEYHAHVQHGGDQNMGQVMMPAGQMGHGYAMGGSAFGNTHMASMQLAMNTSFDPTQMQTPPPTRGTSVKKPQPMNIAFGTPSTIASRRIMTPQQPMVSDQAPFAQQTPAPFPHLHFSPDVYQFANFGPASAPAMPQSRFSWDQTSSPTFHVPQATLDDPFAPNPSQNMGWSIHAHPQRSAQAVSFDTPAMGSFPMQAVQQRPASAVPDARFSMPPTNEPVPQGVNPSLLYSSPLRPIARANSRSKKARPAPTAVEGPRTEDGANTHGLSDANLAVTDANVSNAASNLRRSNTTGTSRPKSAQMSMSAVDSLSRSASINHPPRTASPLKRFSRPSLGSISEGKPRQRASVILTVDENGRARTETRRADDSPTKSIRERYPALFDSDTSDGESDTSEQTPSRPTSFALDKNEERRTKAARLDPPVENLEGLSIPRSSSSASMKKGVPPSRAAVTAAAQLRRQSSLRRPTPGRNSLARRSLANSSTSSLIDTCPMDMSNPQRQSVNGAEQHPSFQTNREQDGGGFWTSYSDGVGAPPHSSAETTLEAHNRRWSIMSLEQHNLPPAPSSQQQQYQAPHPQLQPKNLPIRCTCGVVEDRGLRLLQCASCLHWLHSSCLGIDGSAMPAHFTCFICTASHFPRRKSGVRGQMM